MGTQAVLNVLTGERYKVMSQETKRILHGDYGRTVKPFNREIQKKAIGEALPITCRPADLLAPELETLAKKQWRVLKSRKKMSCPMPCSLR